MRRWLAHTSRGHLHEASEASLRRGLFTAQPSSIILSVVAALDPRRGKRFVSGRFRNGSGRKSQRSSVATSAAPPDAPETSAKESGNTPLNVTASVPTVEDVQNATSACSSASATPMSAHEHCTVRMFPGAGAPVAPAANGSAHDDATLVSSATTTRRDNEALVHLARRTVTLARDLHNVQQALSHIENDVKAISIRSSRDHTDIAVLHTTVAQTVNRLETVALMSSQQELRFQSYMSSAEKTPSYNNNNSKRAAAAVAAVTEPAPGSPAAAGNATYHVDAANGRPTRIAEVPPTSAPQRSSSVSQNDFEWLLNRVEALSATVAMLQQERLMMSAAPVQRSLPERSSDQLQSQVKTVAAVQKPLMSQTQTPTTTLLSGVRVRESADGTIVATGCTVIISNVPPSVSAAAIRSLMQSAGAVRSTYVTHSVPSSSLAARHARLSQQSATKGSAVAEGPAGDTVAAHHRRSRTMLVTFLSVSEANEAVRRFNGYQITSQGSRPAATPSRAPAAAVGSSAAVGDDVLPAVGVLVVEPYPLHDVAAATSNVLLRRASTPASSTLHEVSHSNSCAAPPATACVNSDSNHVPLLSNAPALDLHDDAQDMVDALEAP